jgi:hypothetical protein
MFFQDFVTMIIRVLLLSLFIAALFKPDIFLLIFLISAGLYQLYYFYLVLIPKPNIQLVKNKYVDWHEFEIISKYYQFFKYPVRSRVASRTLNYTLFYFLIIIGISIYKNNWLLAIPLIVNSIILISFLMPRLAPIFYFENSYKNSDTFYVGVLKELHDRINNLHEFSVSNEIKEFPPFIVKKDIMGNPVERIYNYPDGNQKIILSVFDQKKRVEKIFCDNGYGSKDYRQFSYDIDGKRILSLDLQLDPNIDIYESYKKYQS